MGDVVINVNPIVVYISPMGFHRYASEFLSAASGLKAEATFSPVPYYLICRSIELSLKSYLLAKGIPQKKLKKRDLGHDLVKVLHKAQSMGIGSIVQVTQHQEMEIKKANKYYAFKGFEYFQVVRAATGYRDRPDLSVLHELASVLVKDLKKSPTSGIAGGLKYVNRSKRYKTRGHLKGGGYCLVQTQLIQPLIFVFLFFDISSDCLFVSAYCRDMETPGPKFLTRKIFPSTEILSCYMNSAFPFYKTYHL
jgi:hypothetical protein